MSREWHERHRSRSTERRRYSRSRSRSRSREHRRSRSPDWGHRRRSADRGWHRRRSRSGDRSGSSRRDYRHSPERRSRSHDFPGEAPGGWGPPPQQGLPPWHQQGDGGREEESAGWHQQPEPDAGWAPAPYPHGGGDAYAYRRRDGIPSASVHVKGIPEEADESDLYHTFAAYPNILSIKLLRDRSTQASRGMAYIDFASVADAQLLMESEGRSSLAMGGGAYTLTLDYSHSNKRGPAGAVGGAGAPGSSEHGPGMDWVCDMCSCVNFARRLECFQCFAARPANPRRVDADSYYEPSHVVKVSAIDPWMSEEALLAFLMSVVPSIVDLRVIKDKFTGAPRHYAFVELPSIPEAGRLVLGVNGATPPGASQPLRAAYAKPRDTDGSGMQQQQQQQSGLEAAGVGVGPGSGADAAAAGLSGWKPREFDAAAALGDAQAEEAAASTQQATPQGGHHGQPSSGGAGAAAAQQSSEGVPQHQQQQQQHQQRGGGDGGPAAGGSSGGATDLVAQAEALEAAGFTFDLASGYWYEPRTGYYYDANTQLYYHPSTQQWYQLDPATGQYSAVGAAAGTQPQQQQQQQAQQQIAAAGHAQQQQQQVGTGPQPAPDKERRAVIGASAKYNPEGLKAAAAAAKEKEEEQRRQAAAQAAWELQQMQQQSASQKRAKGQQTQPLAPGRPGIGSAAASRGQAAAGTASQPAQLSVVSDGGVQGVIHRSKWAQRNQPQN